jgi:hypothetical protein
MGLEIDSRLGGEWQLVHEKKIWGANPAIASDNASVVNFYNSIC